MHDKLSTKLGVTYEVSRGQNRYVRIPLIQRIGVVLRHFACYKISSLF